MLLFKINLLFKNRKLQLNISNQEKSLSLKSHSCTKFYHFQFIVGGQPSIQPVVINLDSTKYYSKSGIKKKCEQTELIHSYIWYFFMKFMNFHVKKCHQNFSLVTLIFFYSDLLAISKTHTQKKIKIKIQTFKHQTTARMEDEECKMPKCKSRIYFMN